MDKSMKNFLKSSTLLILVLIAVEIIFSYFYFYSSLNTYNSILLFLMLLIILLAVLLIMAAAAMYCTYKTKQVNPTLLWPLRFGMKVLLPFVLFISDMFNFNKDSLRSFYIDVNNIVVDSAKKAYSPDEILVLLPHCLQNSDCGNKITNNIDNCKECGKCCIGSIARIGREFGLRVVVVTGGTAARNVVSRYKPGMILSVACERDLAIGIADVAGTPVFGLVNERPNGPCFNTTVDVMKLRMKLMDILGSKAEGS